MSQEHFPHLHAVILAGGSGTRLWPLSTRDKPKQFLSVGPGGSLLQRTYDRLAGLVPPESVWVVCGRHHVAQVREQLPRVPVGQILAEPTAKNTAAAIGLAAVHLRHRDEAAVMAVLPADHFIPEKDGPAFRRDLSAAAAAAQGRSLLVTLGIKPAGPSTGYGYLEKDASGADAVAPVKAFHEKPGLETARRYAADPRFFWNSGMFVWKAAVFLEEMAAHLPKTAAALERLVPALGTGDWETPAAEIFSGLENISVDFAVMEKSDRVAMVEASFAWDDVGSLISLAALNEEDSRGNRISGAVIPLDAEGNLVLSRGKIIALLGVKDLLIVEGEKAILIAAKDRDQEVKRLVEHLKEAGRDDLL